MKDEEQTVFCPLCGTKTKTEHVRTLESEVKGHILNGIPADSSKINHYYIEKCIECKGPLIYCIEDVGNKNFGEVSFPNAVLVYPPDGTLPDVVPIEVANYFRKAILSMNSNKNRFARNARKGLEAICIDKEVGHETDPLYKKIETLVIQENLPNLIKEMVHSLRKFGNFASHASIEPKIKHAHVPAIHSFYETLVKYVYILPEEVKQANIDIEKAKNMENKTA